MVSNDSGFARALARVGAKPTEAVSQHATRHYSERVSREISLWIKEELSAVFDEATVLPPEAKVDTVFGVGSRGKCLDVGVVDRRRYLLVDVSIKTFNFKDRVTGNYRHNYTGRFYELLGEELDIRRSYPLATLVALIFLPEDSTSDSSPSSFAHCVRQFGKISKPSVDSTEQGFDYVFVAVHNEAGAIYFFDARVTPTIQGHPPEAHRLSLQDVLARIRASFDSRRTAIQHSPLPSYKAFEYAPRHNTQP